jgi:hypothetical protein
VHVHPVLSPEKLTSQQHQSLRTGPDEQPAESSHLEPEFLLPEHYHAFGRIVQAFVAVEDFYTGIIANRIGVDNGNAFFLLSNTGYEGVHKIMKT